MSRAHARAFALLVALAACKRAGPVTTPLPNVIDATPSTVAPPDAAPATRADPTCTVGSPTPVDGTGFNVSDVSSIQVAATATRGVMTFKIEGDRGCPYDGCYVYGELFGSDVDASGNVSKVAGLPSSSAGVSPTADAAPFAIGEDLYVLTQGHGGAAPMPMPGADAPDTLYLLKDGKIVWRSVKWFSGHFVVAGGSNGGLAVGTGDEWPWYHTGFQVGPSSVRAFPLSPATATKGELVAKAAGAEQNVNDQLTSGAVAQDGDRAAVAYLHTKDGATELIASWVDPKTGKPLGDPVSVAKGGALLSPTLLLSKDTLSIVWPKRDAPKGPMHFEHATWKVGDAKPASLGVLTLPAGAQTSSWAPLALLGDRVAIAWVHDGRVWAGFGADVALAASKATVRSPDGVKAWGPALSASGDHALLAWGEGEKKKISLRAAWCK